MNLSELPSTAEKGESFIAACRDFLAELLAEEGKAIDRIGEMDTDALGVTEEDIEKNSDAEKEARAVLMARTIMKADQALEHFSQQLTRIRHFAKLANSAVQLEQDRREVHRRLAKLLDIDPKGLVIKPGSIPSRASVGTPGAK